MRPLRNTSTCRTAYAFVLCSGSIVLPSMIAFVLLRMHARLDWEVWLIVFHQHYDEHERALREFGTAMSTWRALRVRASCDPFIWNAALRRWSRTFVRRVARPQA